MADANYQRRTRDYKLFSIVVGAGAYPTLCHCRAGRLVVLTLLLNSWLAVAAAVTALAVVPAGTGRLILVGIHLLDGFVAVDALAAVEGIQLILLDDVDELVGIVGILGIAAVAQALGPAAVVPHVKLIEHAVARRLEELGMVKVGILRSTIFAVSHCAERVTCAIDLTLPVIGLDAEVVVGLAGHLALADAALQDALGQRDAGRNTELAFMLQGYCLVALDIVKISLMFGLCRCPKGAKHGKKQAKNQYLLVYRKNFYNFAFQLKTHNFIMTEKKITTKVRVYSYNELNEEQKKLVDMAREATTHSYSPYSNFKVGAALKLDNGEV